ncbi:MAG: hypothetical protein JSR80_00810 [Verrucomicrobia bacterium]|nr:hypothetical protein [Verrucomicrobiota bacterium]
MEWPWQIGEGKSLKYQGQDTDGNLANAFDKGNTGFSLYFSSSREPLARELFIALMQNK